MPRQLSLAHLTVLDTTPPELVSVAAAAGFHAVGIRLTAPPSVGVPPYDILSEGPLLRDTLARLKDTGITVLDTEFLRFEPDRPVGIPEGFLEVSARLSIADTISPAMSSHVRLRKDSASAAVWRLKSGISLRQRRSAVQRPAALSGSVSSIERKATGYRSATPAPCETNAGMPRLNAS